MDSNRRRPVRPFRGLDGRGRASEPNDPNAICLATCTPEGRPSARIVLLKGVDPARLRLLHQHGKPQGRRTAGQPLRRAAVPLEALRRQRPHRGSGRARHRRRGRCLLRLPRARLAPRRLGQPAVARRWKAASRWRRRWRNTTVKFGIGEIPRPPNSGPASACCRSGSSSGANMPFRLHDRQVFHRAPEAAGRGLPAGAIGSAP